MNRKETICILSMVILSLGMSIFYWVMLFVELAFIGFICSIVFSIHCNYGSLAFISLVITLFVTPILYFKVRISLRELIEEKL